MIDTSIVRVCVAFALRKFTSSKAKSGVRIRGTCYYYEMNILNIKAFGGLLFLLLVMAALTFIPAWTLDFWQAWTFLAIYFASSLAITLYLMKKDPKLLERRMRGGPTAEKEPTQKIIMLFVSLGFIGLIAFSALIIALHGLTCRRMWPSQETRL